MNFGLCVCLQNLHLVENVEKLAAKKGCTPGQLALAWVLARGNDVIPIPGTKRVSCFDENLAALNIKLTPEECQDLESAVPHHKVDFRPFQSSAGSRCRDTRKWPASILPASVIGLLVLATFLNSLAVLHAWCARSLQELKIHKDCRTSDCSLSDDAVLRRR